jgi:1-acyl-sn-glycerol-3-phosphate acyltransferase
METAINEAGAAEAGRTSVAAREHPCAATQVQQGNAARASLYVKTARLLVRALLSFFLQVRITGLRNLPHGSAIICCNHLGWADFFLVLCYLPVAPRIYVLGYSLDYIEDPGARAFREKVIGSLKVMVPLHVDRPVEAARVTTGLLKRGGSLLIFPEGTYMGAEEGKLLELQPGAAHFSQISGAPLVPVGITGTRELWFRKSVTLRVGKPIYPKEFEGSTHERVDAMTGRLEKELRAMLPGDHERARIRLLRKWLTMLFYGEEHFTRPEQRKPS